MTVAVPSSVSALEGDYTIQSGDSLSKIAQQNETTWEDLHQKNSYIADPNLIYAGNQLVVKGEVAKPAEPVAPVQPVVAPTPVPTQPPAPICNEATQWVRADNGQCKEKAVAAAPTVAPAPVAPARVYAGNSSGNTYDGGACTWHVKNMRPDLPNNLGNADQWYYNAQSQGLSTGLTAQVGAAASKKWGMHVVYVLEVYGDGTMLVSEMNYDYVAYHQRTSIKNQADFYYVY